MKWLLHRMETVRDLLGYATHHRPWLLPLLVGLLALSGLVGLAQASQISPLIYTLF